MADNNPFEPIYLTDEALYRYGEMLGKNLGYKPGDKLDGYVEKLGGTIHYSTSPSLDEKHEDGSIVIKKEGEFDIFIPNLTSPLRDRFTIGHELGHYFLHSKAGEITGKLARYGKKLIEYEANCFSAGLLMPEEKFIKFYNKGLTIIQLGGRFQTSWSSIEFRIDYLKKAGKIK